MIIKSKNTELTSINYFELFGDNELAITKGLAYILSKNFDAYYLFLKLVGLKYLNKKSFIDSEIKIETSYSEGRTDLEIISENFHVIIESKIKINRIKKQRKQYLSVFQNRKNKILCFLTQEYDSNYQVENDVEILYITWRDVLNLFNNSRLSKQVIIRDFLQFLQRTLNMKNNNEILIQDLGDELEIKRFVDYNLYRRDETYGDALYFAPYFTEKSKLETGINCISKVLGIVTFSPKESNSYKEELKKFTDDKKLVELWFEGLNLRNEDKKFTYYFLDYPFRFPKPLLKDGGKKKGRGKNWIAAMIPKNRRVGFIDLLSHIPELMKE